MRKRIFLIAMLCLLGATAADAQIRMGLVQTNIEDYAYYNNAAFSAVTGHGYVTDPQNSRVIVFDPMRSAGNIVTIIPTGNEPAGIFITPDGLRACVLNAGSTSVTIIQLSDHTVKTYAPPNAQFSLYGNIAFTPDSQYGFVCNNKLSANQVFIFNLSTGQVTSTLSTGIGPVRTYINPAGDKAFVLCNGQSTNDQITVVNIASPPSFTVLNTFNMVEADFDRSGTRGVCHNNIVFAPDGTWGYVCDSGLNDVLSFNIPTYSSQYYIHFTAESHSNASLSRIAITPDGHYVLASSIILNRIYVIDVQTNPHSFTLYKEIYDSSGEAGWDGYNNIVVLPEGTTAAIASIQSSELVCFDWVTGNILSYTPTGPVGAGPEQITLAPDGIQLAAVNVLGAPNLALKDSVGLICLYPRVMNAPILVTGTPEFTGYAVSNPTPAASSFIAYAIDKDGYDMPGVYNPAYRVLEPQSQLPFIGTDLFGLSSPTTPAWVQIFSNSWDARGFFLEADSAGTYMDGTVASDSTFRDFYITRVSELYGNGSYSRKTEITVANPFAASVTVDLTLKDSTGATLGNVVTDRAIPPGALLSGSLRDLFFRDWTSVDVSGAYIVGKVKSTFGAVTGMALTRFYDGNQACVTVRTLPLSANTGASTLYCPHVATGGELPGFTTPYDTTFSVINTAAEAATVTFTLHRDGVAEPLVGQAVVPAGGQYIGPAWALFALPDPATHPVYVTGYAVVTSTRSGLIGDVVFGDGINTVPQFQSALPMEPTAYTACVFSHVAAGPMQGSTLVYFNGFSLVNPSTTKTIAVQMKVFKESGVATGQKTLSVPPLGRILNLINSPDVIPSANGQIGGYVTLNSIDPFLALELFQDGSLKMLSGIPRN